MKADAKIITFLESKGFRVTDNDEFWLRADKDVQLGELLPTLHVRLSNSDKSGIPTRCRITTNLLPYSKALNIKGSYKWITVFDSAVESVLLSTVIYSKMSNAKEIKRLGRQMLDEAQNFKRY